MLLMIQNITIILLSLACVSLIVKDKVIYYINKKKKLREKRDVTRIQKIVNDYLKEIANDRN